MVNCIFGLKNLNEIPYSKDLEEFAQERSGHFLPVMQNAVGDCVSRLDEEFSHTKNLKLFLNGVEAYPWKRTDFYLCGDAEMIEEVEQVLFTRGVNQHSIYSEAYYDQKRPSRRNRNLEERAQL